MDASSFTALPVSVDVARGTVSGDGFAASGELAPEPLSLGVGSVEVDA